MFGSSQGSSTEDLFTDSIDSCDLDITEKVKNKAGSHFITMGSITWSSVPPPPSAFVVDAPLPAAVRRDGDAVAGMLRRLPVTARARATLLTCRGSTF